MAMMSMTGYRRKPSLYMATQPRIPIGHERQIKRIAQKPPWAGSQAT